jgi:hypothetical protein
VGSNETNAGGVIAGQPTPGRAHACDAAPSSGAYCFGGFTYLNGKSVFHFGCDQLLSIKQEVLLLDINYSRLCRLLAI